MMSDKPNAVDEFDPERYSGEGITVSGRPEVGKRVVVEYDSNTGGSREVSGEVLYAEPWGTGEDVVVVFHDTEDDRAVAATLSEDPGYSGAWLKSLAASGTKHGRRIGDGFSVTFTGEDVSRMGPAASTLHTVRPGDAVMVDGTEYGVLRRSEYGPEDRPSTFSAVLARPDGSEYELKTSTYHDVPEFSERYGEGVDGVDATNVEPGRFRERYYAFENEDIQPEDTTDAFPAPHRAREGERLSFTLTEDGDDEAVRGVVAGVRYFPQTERSDVLADEKKEPPETRVELDDGREVTLTNKARRGTTSWVTGSRRAKMGDNGYVRAFVVQRGEDGDSEYRHVEAVDIRPEPTAGEDSDDSEDADVETDGGEPRTEGASGGGSGDIPEVVIPGEGSGANRFHAVFSPCTFHMSASERVTVDRAESEGFKPCTSCSPPTYGETKVMTDGGAPVDPVPQCPQCSDHQDRTQYRVEVRDGTEYLTCPNCGNEFPGRELETATDGGSVADRGGELPEPPADAPDPHREVKVKVIRVDPVLMVRTVGEDAEYVAVWRDADADEDDVERYQLLMELGDYEELDPFTTLDSDPGGARGEGVTLDLWALRSE